MVFLSPAEFDTAYDKIKTDALKGDSTVQIFVAPDVDSLCASQILTALLQSDFIRYTQIPCADLGDLHEQRDALIANPGDVQSIIMINGGGNIDVLEEFQALEEQPLAHLTFYIIDSHRPLHLANVYDDDRVYLFDDGMTKIPKMEDVVYNSEDDDDEDEEEEALDQSSDEEDEGVDGEDAEGGGGAKKKESKSKRRRMDGRMSPRSRREHRETVALRAEDYYRSSSYGASAAVLLWQLAGDLGKTDNALLWLSIVGLTDQFVHDRIDNTTYTLLFDQLSTDVNRMNSTDEEGEALDRIKISVTEELRVLLMRHWTVHDAMLHSRYVSTRMGTWRQRGKTQLKNLLAKMGMSLEQCNQKFTSMDLQSKDRLFDSVMEYSAEFKLDQIAFPSFTSQASFRLQYSASDTVNALVGLLEANAAREGETVDWKANFYRAVDALGMKKPDLFAIGMEQCQRQHGAILRQVESVIEGTNGVRVTGAFRYVVIKDHPDQAYFVHPAILQHLGNYLMDYWRFNPSGKKKALPLVLCAQNSTIEEFIVVGIWNSPSRGEGKVVPNEFGKFFEIATEDMGARATLTAFDTSVMQIKSDDLNKFLMQLTQTIKTSGARAGRL